MPIQPINDKSIRCSVYTPPGYDPQSDTRYPTLYLLHGRGDNETSWEDRGQIAALADELIQNGKIDPLIIVMPYGYLGDEDENVKQKIYNYPAPDLFRKHLLTRIIPAVEKEFRVKQNRESRALAGVSMGSEQTLDVGLHDLNSFSSLGCISPALPRQQYSANTILQRWPALAGYKEKQDKLRLCHLSWGTGEKGLAGYERIRDELTKHGVAVTSKTFPGGHNWGKHRLWPTCLADFLVRLSDTWKDNTTKSAGA